MKVHIKKGDMVRVVSGTAKNKEGQVKSVNIKTQRVVVEGVKMMKRHVKPSAQNPDGGIVEKEAEIHISNVMLLDSKGNTTRVGRQKDKNGKSVRVAKTTGEEIK